MNAHDKARRDLLRLMAMMAAGAGTVRCAPGLTPIPAPAPAAEPVLAPAAEPTLAAAAAQSTIAPLFKEISLVEGPADLTLAPEFTNLTAARAIPPKLPLEVREAIYAKYGKPPLSIVQLGQLAQDPNFPIDKNILAEAVRSAAVARAGVKPSDPMYIMDLQQGTAVPEAFLNILERQGITLDNGAIVGSGWKETWSDAVCLWKNVWKENQSSPVIDQISPSLLKEKLSPAELAVVNDLKVLDLQQ